MNRWTPAKLALAGIRHRRFRSACIVALVAFATFLITAGTVLGLGLRGGVESVKARLGADGMIVPRSADDTVEGALLQGSPSTFYMPAGATARLLQIEGVTKATPQLFIASFDSAHCSAYVQIIGYDPETDFVIAPWFEDAGVAPPQDGEIVAGANVTLPPGSQMGLYGTILEVVGKLDPTGMGFDNSVFVNMETARALVGEYEKYNGALPLPEGLGADEVVSAVLFETDAGADPTAIKAAINNAYRGEGVRIVTAQALLESTSKNMDLVIGVLTVLLAAIWVFAVFVFAIIFALALNERQREFGILRAIGATRRKLAAIAMAESTLLCGFGAAAGTGAVCLVVFPYRGLIEQALQAAYLPPGSGAFAAALLGCFALGAAIGPASTLFSIARIGKGDAFANLQEGV
jgi:putative ABC transport system permease protein